MNSNEEMASIPRLCEASHMAGRKNTTCERPGREGWGDDVGYNNGHHLEEDGVVAAASEIYRGLMMAAIGLATFYTFTASVWSIESLHGAWYKSANSCSKSGSQTQ
ncbi:hypothetical protein GOP47_0010129 [Adiantum capillus-veneris]|uniref:Uncharacterized protein n=1 Tax=Adiantum capillus-veneris TaxID=13818 RepID=A0A9D4ZG18_ADICA|nr:hypothetical protein GOP47_0010129 [Adiantum capillus-veneris]